MGQKIGYIWLHGSDTKAVSYIQDCINTNI